MGIDYNWGIKLIDTTMAQEVFALAFPSLVNSSRCKLNNDFIADQSKIYNYAEITWPE